MSVHACNPCTQKDRDFEILFPNSKIGKNMTLATNKKLGKIVKSCNDKENKASVRLFSLKE